MTAVHWTHRVSEVGEPTREVRREAQPSELAAIARELQVPSCAAFATTYAIRPIGRGRCLLTGKVAATITQACVVTLDPITSEIREDFEIELWPHDELPAASADDLDAFAADDPEGIENGVIDVGRIVIESVAGAIDRYPRKPDAVFSWTDDTDDGSDNPFAKLKNLRNPS